MTLGDVANKARALTHTDTTSYTAANLLIDINIWYQKVVSMILESQDEADFDDARNTDYPVVTTPMVAGQRDYAIPVSENVLKIKRVDVTYDNSNWYRATPTDSGTIDFGQGNTTNEDANYIQQAPEYDVKYNSVWVYPEASATDVSAGAKIRVEWERSITPFTSADYTTDPNDSTVVLGFDAPLHAIVSDGAAFEKAKADNLPNLQVLAQGLVDWEGRVRSHYGKKQIDRQLAMGMVYDDNFGR
jgi:hypothetical protein